MRGNVRFGMIIRLDMDAGRRDDHLQSISRIQQELQSDFLIVVPINHQEDVLNFHLITQSIFEIDPALKKIECPSII